MGFLGLFLGIVGLIGGALYPVLFPLNILVEVIFLIISVIGFFTSIMGISNGNTVSGAFGIVFCILAIICCAALTFGSSKIKEWTGFEFFQESTPVETQENGTTEDVPDEVIWSLDQYI